MTNLWSPICVLCVTLLLTLSVYGNENLIANPGFEQEAVDEGVAPEWSLRDAEGVMLRHDGGHSGEQYVRFVDKGEGGIFLESKRLSTRPNGTYKASAWFRTDDNMRCGVYLNFYDNEGERVHHTFNRVQGPTDGWERKSVTTTAPPCAEVSVALYSYSADAGAFDADDVRMTVNGGDEPLSEKPRVKKKKEGPLNIGSRRELFVDDFLVDKLTGGVERRLHHPAHREVVLRLTKPWEGNLSAYFTVLRDGERILLYYRGNPPRGPEVTCVAESADGVNFTRPNVGLIEYNGSKENNIIWRGHASHNFTPFKDANPDAKPEHQFKAVGYYKGRNLGTFVSPDGIDWKVLGKEPIITRGAFDSQNLVFWDPVREIYVDYHRGWRSGVRDILTCTSEDFIHWPQPRWVVYTDERKEHLYTNGIKPYFRAPHIYIGIPARFVPGRKKVPDHPNRGVSDAILMSSRDGIHFDRWEEAFIRPGPEPEVWTDRNNYPAWGMVQASNEKIALYWTEHYRHPGMRLRRGTIRTDGFVSVHAGGDAGEMLTRPLVFSGDRLVVNYATSAIGSLKFELCNLDGSGIKGYTMKASEVLFGNEIRHIVTWKNNSDLSNLAGRPVRLRVRLHDADLYAIRFEEKDKR